MGLADSMFQAASQSAQNQGAGFADSLAKGAQLAVAKQQNDMQQQQINAKQKELQTAKYGNFMDALSKGNNLQGQARSNYMKNMAAYRDSLGLTEQFPDAQLSFWTSTPETMGKLNGIKAQVAQGVITEEQGVALFQDIAQAQNIPSVYLEDGMQELAKSGKEALDRKAQVEAAKQTQIGQNQRQQNDINNTGNVSAQSEIGKNFGKFTAAGGAAAIDSNLELLKSARETLKSGKVKLGTVAKNVPYGSVAAVLARTDPAAKEFMDSVLMKYNTKAATGDPNPTAQQITDVQSRLVDPKLDNAANIRKLDAEIKSVEKNKNNALRTFKQYGLIPATEDGGGEPPPGNPAAPTGKPLISMADFDDAAKMNKIKAFIGSNNERLNSIAKQYGLSPTMLTRILGGK